MTDEVARVLAPVLAHPYVALFVALLFAGDSVLVPALTMAVAHELSVTSVLLVSTLATMLSDAGWHSLGRALSSRQLRRMLGRRADLLDRSVGVFEDHPARGLFWSKYLWGTKILAQVLSGRMRMAWRLYLPVNLGADELSTSTAPRRSLMDVTLLSEGDRSVRVV